MPVDLSQTKPPPPTGQPRKPRTPAKPKEAPKATEERLESRTEGVNQWFQMVAGGLLLTGNVPDGAAVADHGERISREAVNLAEENAQVCKVVDYLCAAGPFAGLFGAVIPLILQIAVNHGKLPAEPLAQLGVVTPEVAVMKMQAKAMHQAADLAEQQADAERALHEAQERLRQAQAA